MKAAIPVHFDTIRTKGTTASSRATFRANAHRAPTDTISVPRGSAGALFRNARKAHRTKTPDATAQTGSAPSSARNAGQPATDVRR